MEPTQLAFDFVTSNPMPVELLRDGRGVYGIGISDFYRKVRPPAYDLKKPHTLILRPDRFDDTPPAGAVLQKIIGGFRRGIFHDSLEENLRRFLHHEALRRAGCLGLRHITILIFRLIMMVRTRRLGGPPTKNNRHAIAAFITVCAYCRSGSSII
jgi:hypothetical protein